MALGVTDSPADRSPPRIIPLFLLALFLQRQYEKSKSIIPSTLIHAGFNLISVFLLILEVYYHVGE